MGATGIVTIDFGSAPGGNFASGSVTGQSTITTASYCEAWMMAESSSAHNLIEHAIVPIKLTCGNLSASSGFQVFAFSEWRLTGVWTVRWVWN